MNFKSFDQNCFSLELCYTIRLFMNIRSYYYKTTLQVMQYIPEKFHLKHANEKI